MKTFAKLASLLVPLALCTGCPETVGQQCPSNSVPIGQYQLGFALEDPPGGCRITSADAGTLDASIGQTNAAPQIATFCAGPGDGGTITLTLAVPTKATRSTELLDGGGFVFTGHTDPTAGTICGCSLAIDETFSGTLLVPGDAGFALQADGGIPLVTSVTGKLVDAVTSPNPPCLCNVPCTLNYNVSGTRF